MWLNEISVMKMRRRKSRNLCSSINNKENIKGQQNKITIYHFEMKLFLSRRVRGNESIEINLRRAAVINVF